VATFTSAVIEIPLGESYAFYLQVTAASGTSPTLDMAIQVTPDNGTTFYTAARFAQMTGVAIRRLQIQPMMGRGEAGTESVIADTGGALNANTIITRKIKYKATIAGTNPSFTYTLWVLVVSRSSGD